MKTTSNTISSTNTETCIGANFIGSIWCSVGTEFVSSDARINKKVDIHDDKALNIQPKYMNIKM